MSELRAARRLLHLLLLLFTYVPLHYAWRLTRRRSPWPRRFLAAAARACGVRLAVHGEPLPRDVLLVANHSSWLDILILGGATGAAFVAKAEVGATPLVGWLAGLNRTVYVKREDRRDIPAQLDAIRGAMHDGPVAIFPEGTTNNGVTLLPFKASLLQVLDPAPPGAMLQPLFLDYGEAAAEIAWGEETGTGNALRLLGRKGTIDVSLHCLAPLNPAEVGGRKVVAAESRASILLAAAACGSRLGAGDAPDQ